MHVPSWDACSYDCHCVGIPCCPPTTCAHLAQAEAEAQARAHTNAAAASSSPGPRHDNSKLDAGQQRVSSEQTGNKRKNNKKKGRRR